MIKLEGEDQSLRRPDKIRRKTFVENGSERSVFRSIGFIKMCAFGNLMAVYKG
jgi:hypothetical protein